jgi:DMSO/TMAO reductase YedYZ molybdopterin-dependent catalytic subunit
MKRLVGSITLGLLGLGFSVVAGCSAPAAVANPAPAPTEAAAPTTTITATAAATPTVPPTATAQPTLTAQTTITVTGAVSPCVLAPIVVPTMPARNPGYALPDPATGNRLHITGQATEIDVAAYRLKVTGKVERPLELTYDELRCMPRTTVHCTLVCPGFFEDVASWTGVPVAHILDLVGVQPTASGIKLVSVDGYRIEVSLSAARQAQNVLAYQWENEPLPVLHGFPLRAVFPDLQGNHWVKWLVEIQVY